MKGNVGAAWDERYDGDVYRYGKTPNVFLAENADQLPAGGAILCVGDGEGRNGVWLAEQGFDVTSVDASAVGVEKTRALAKERGVSVNAIHAEVPAGWAPEPQSFDGVVLIFVHMPPPVRAAVHAELVKALKPGGVLLLEAYTPAQLELGTGGPPSEVLMFTKEILESDFSALDFAYFKEERTMLEEGVGHSGESEVIRLIATKA